MIVVEQTIVEQLVNNYLSDNEWWHKNKLFREEATKYFDKLLKNGNILYYALQGKLVGYVEFWRLNFEQWGRIVCHVPFSAYHEDVEHGNICYVANVWIDKQYRHGRVMKILKYWFFKMNRDCEFFVGEALRKKTQPIKVFSYKEFINKYLKEG